MFTVEKRADVWVVTRQTEQGPLEYTQDTALRSIGGGCGRRLTDRERLDELVFVLHTTGQIDDGERELLYKAIKHCLSTR